MTPAPTAAWGHPGVAQPPDSGGEGEGALTLSHLECVAPRQAVIPAPTAAGGQPGVAQPPESGGDLALGGGRQPKRCPEDGVELGAVTEQCVKGDGIPQASLKGWGGTEERGNDRVSPSTPPCCCPLTALHLYTAMLLPSDRHSPLHPSPPALRPPAGHLPPPSPPPLLTSDCGA